MTYLPQIPDGPSEATGLAGWYVDPDNPVQSRRWDGETWTDDVGPLTPLTQRFPGASAASRVDPSPGGALRVVAGIVFLLAAISAVVVVIVGAKLVTHNASACDDFGYCTTSHPYRAAGTAVLVGGLAQAFVLAVVGWLCVTVAELRDR